MKWLIILAMTFIEPQEGYQMDVAKSDADIVIGGGAAGSGKTFSLLLESLRHVDNPNYRGVIFRRTMEQVKQSGGLFDTSQSLFPYAYGVSREQPADWTFRSGAKVKFAHLQYEKDKLNWQGAQMAFVGFDEITHFTKTQFFYIVTRARSISGIKTYFRATCNPDPDSWLVTNNGIWGDGLISWWIDSRTGYPIDERRGVVRWFTQDGDAYVFGDTPEEVMGKCAHIFNAVGLKDRNPRDLVKSLTFIGGSVYENKILLESSPEYLGNLLSQDDETKAQLLDGNWMIRTDGNELIDYTKLQDAFTNEFVGLDENRELLKDTKKYISTDIAMQGSDRFVVFVWAGWRLIDCAVMDKSDSKEILEKIEEFAMRHKVPRSHIVYDADGLGTYLRGFLSGARAFVNNSKAMGNEQFKNLKSQCAFKLAEKINSNEVFITKRVAEYKMTDGKKAVTMSEIITNERRCLKRLKPDSDNKLEIIPKDQMKNINGRSPDILDALIMRAYFDILTTNKIMTYG